MKAIMLRRKKLGKTSCEAISSLTEGSIITVRNDQKFPDEIDLVIRWGTTSTVPVKNVLNTAKAIHTVNNKLEFRKILNDKGLSPKTWFNFEDLGPDEYPYPVIIRPAFHSQGKGIYLCKDAFDILDVCQKLGNGNYYISEYIQKVVEYRIFIVQGRVAAVANKIPGNPDDIAWNVAKGGKFENVKWGDWPLKAIKHSIEAFNLSGLDFGGVDVMVDENNTPYILEINSAPSLTSPYRQSCMAKCFSYILEKGKSHIPLISEKGGWKKFIHPAISEEALL